LWDPVTDLRLWLRVVMRGAPTTDAARDVERPRRVVAGGSEVVPDSILLREITSVRQLSAIK
jgi:hypothetical protein